MHNCATNPICNRNKYVVIEMDRNIKQAKGVNNV